MEIFRFNITSLEQVEKLQAFKEAVNNCPICTQPMHFEHETDYLTNTLREQAYCQHCQAHVREEEFKIQ